MPSYSYYCDCGEACEIEYTWDQVNSGALGNKPKCPNCGETMKRDYSGISINADQGKFDPSSPMFWKRGKSNEQISRVLTGEAPMP